MKPLGADFVREAQKGERYPNKIVGNSDLKKEYSDHMATDMEFQIGEQVLMKVSPMKGTMRLGK